MLASASNSSGQAAYDSTLGELLIDTSGPTAAIVPVVPSPRKTALDSLAIQFSSPVSGFSIQNLQLTFNGLSAPLAGATLTSVDGQNWTLGNLAGLDWLDGTYQITYVSVSRRARLLADRVRAAQEKVGGLIEELREAGLLDDEIRRLFEARNQNDLLSQKGSTAPYIANNVDFYTANRLVSKIAGPSGMIASPRLLFWNLRPFSTEVTRTFTCSSSDAIASFIARAGSSEEGDITSSMRS